MKFGFSFPDQIIKQTESFLRVNLAKTKQVKEWQEGISNLSSQFSPNLTLNKIRLLYLPLLFFCCGLFLIGRLFQLQVIRGKTNLLLSEGNRIYIRSNPRPRGVIYDQEGKVLARNHPGYRATLTLSRVPPQEEEELARRLSELLLLPESQIKERFKEASEAPFTTATLKSNLDHAMQIKLLALKDELPGIEIEEDIVRSYPQGEFFSHILGYTASISLEELQSAEFSSYKPGDFLGREGIEKNYEKVLRGEGGEKLIEVDAQGEIKRVLLEKEPKIGYSLFLSIKSSWQEKIGKILRSNIDKYQATGGVIILEDVDTGEILSLVSLPTYNNSQFAPMIDEVEFAKLINDTSRPLFNRAISGLYPPGSTVKPAVAQAALQEGIITPQTVIDDFPQVIRIGVWEFPDWTVSWGQSAHGKLTVKDAIAQSCDTFFYKIGGGYKGECTSTKTLCPVAGLGVEKMTGYFRLVGFGSRTGIDLPGEVEGLVPDPQWKEKVKGEPWFLGNTYHLSIGQGDLLTTPLQIVNYVSALSNGGKLLKPRLGHKVQTEDGELVRKFAPQIINENFFDGEMLKIVTEGMRLSVTGGIIFPLRNAKIPVAAKTGTAEFGVKNAQGEYQTHAWITGFFPYEEPKIAFVVLLEAGGKSNNAAEVAKEIINELEGELVEYISNH